MRGITIDNLVRQTGGFIKMGLAQKLMEEYGVDCYIGPKKKARIIPEEQIATVKDILGGLWRDNFKIQWTICDNAVPSNIKRGNEIEQIKRKLTELDRALSELEAQVSLIVDSIQVLSGGGK